MTRRPCLKSCSSSRGDGSPDYVDLLPSTVLSGREAATRRLRGDAELMSRQIAARKPPDGMGMPFSLCREGFAKATKLARSLLRFGHVALRTDLMRLRPIARCTRRFARHRDETAESLSFIRCSWLQPFDTSASTRFTVRQWGVSFRAGVPAS